MPQSQITAIQLVPKNVLGWLLEESNPSVRYRTLTELLGLPQNAPNTKAARQAIDTWPPVLDIFRRMHPEGYWTVTSKVTGKTYGDSFLYAGSVTTHTVLGNLSELGLDRTHPQVRRAVLRYLNVLKSQRDLTQTQSCVDGFVLRTMLRMGFGQHQVVKCMIRLLRKSLRWDNGYQCGRERKTRPTKSCMRGTWKALMAYAQAPGEMGSENVQRLCHYFLDRNVLFRRDNPNGFLRAEVRQTIFPFCHGRASLLEPLYALSRLGYGQHPALQIAWDLLTRKRRENGRYTLDWSPATLFEPMIRGHENKWVTLYAYLALKYRSETQPAIVGSLIRPGSMKSRSNKRSQPVEER